MSRSSRINSTNSAMTVAVSHPDRDVVMGPPPLPPQVVFSASGDSRTRDRESLELAEKYRKLKRKYFELEEKHKDVAIELRGSGERSVQLRHERAFLLDRIAELEAQEQPTMIYPGYQQPLSSAFPRSLISQSAQKRFLGNLERAMSEAESEDHTVDPLLQSKHVGPNARKKMEAEQRERLEEEQREQKRAARQPRKRGGAKEKEKEKELSLAASSSAKQAGPSGERASTRVSERDRERAEREREAVRLRERPVRMDGVQEGPAPPLTLSPAQSLHRDREMHNADSPPPSQTSVLLSTNGHRLRVKPPAPPATSFHHHTHRRSPSPSSPRQERHYQQPITFRYEYENEVRRSPIANRFDPREDQYHPPDRDEMDIDRDPEPQPPQYTHPPPLPPAPSTVPHVHLQGPGQPQSHSSQRSDSPMSSRASPPPAPPSNNGPAPAVLSPIPTAPSPPAPDMRSASSGPRHARKRSDSPAMYSPGTSTGAPEDGVAPAQGGTKSTGTQAAMMGQIVLSPPSPFRLTAVDPPAPKPAMQMTFRTSPATHVSQYGNSAQNANVSPSVTRDPTVEPGLFRPAGVTTPGAPGEILINFNSGTGSAGSTPGVGPGPGPLGPQTPFTVPTAGAGGSRGKPKRLKAHTVTSKSYSIPMVPRDKAGKPLLPLNVGIMTVLNLGEVCMREHFHTERYIFPVGYEVTRRYLSTVDPVNDAVYHCTILDGGDGPKFQIIASDDPDKPVIAGTATGAWSVIVRAANVARNRQHSNSVSGPDFFGLGQNTIKHLIQELAGADRLKDYVWQNFVEGGPLGGRHAAVIPALPDDHDLAEVESISTPTGQTGARPTTPSPSSPPPQPQPQPQQQPPPLPPAQQQPQQTYVANGGGEEPKELQIIHADNSVGNGHSRAGSAGAPPLISLTERSSSLKPITFQQEFPQRYQAYRAREEQDRESSRSDSGRRGSASSSYANDEYDGPGRSQASLPPPPRTASHSPVLQRERYSPHGQQSPYSTPGTAHQPSPQVPAPFASIMHAYPAPPMSGGNAS